MIPTGPFWMICYRGHQICRTGFERTDNQGCRKAALNFSRYSLLSVYANSNPYFQSIVKMPMNKTPCCNHSRCSFFSIHLRFYRYSFIISSKDVLETFFRHQKCRFSTKAFSACNNSLNISPSQILHWSNRIAFPFFIHRLHYF